MPQAKITATGTTKSTGICLISFGPARLGGAWRGRLSVPRSPTTTIWTIAITGVAVGVVIGAASDGPFQITGSEVLTLTATGLVSGTIYQAVLVGAIVASGSTPPIPLPTSSFSYSSISGTVTATISGPVTVTGSVSVAGTITATISGPVTVTGSVSVATGVIDISAPTGVQVVNLPNTVLEVADAQDFLYHGIGYTTTTTVKTTVTLYGLATTTGTFEKLTTSAPGTSVNARGFWAPHKMTKKWLRLALSSPSAVYGTIFTTAPAFPATGALRKVYVGHWATTLSGKSLAPGSYSGKVYLAFGTPTPAHGPIVFSTLVMRVWIWNGTTATLVGSLTATTVTVPANSHTTATLSGTLPASSTLGAATRVVIDLVGRASAPTAGNTSPTSTLRVGHGTTRLKVSLAYKGTSGKAVWTLAIPGSVVKKSYSALVITVNSTTSKLPYCVAAWDATLKTMHKRAGVFVSAFQKLPTGTAKQYQAIVLMANEPGDSLGFKIVWKTATKGTVTIYGLTANPGLQMRNDGRAYPVGTFSAYAANDTSGTTTVITAVATLRILVKSVVLAGYAATAETTPTQLKATINGTTGTIGQVYQTTAGQTVSLDIGDEGLLLDVDTALVLANAAGTKYQSCSVVYDLVL